MGDYLDMLEEDEKNLIYTHLKLVQSANEKVNLTRIDSQEDALILHIEDSLSALPEMNSSPQGRYGDLGSGAGYPGIPLAIATGRQTVLIDARKKKMDIVGEIVRELGLQDQVETYAGRAELLARKENGSFAVLTARALSQLSVLLELASPLLKKHGRLICYKSNVEDKELDHANDVAAIVGMKCVSDREFVLENEFNRRIIVFEKTGKATVTLPRQEGQAQKNPL